MPCLSLLHIVSSKVLLSDIQVLGYYYVAIIHSFMFWGVLLYGIHPFIFFCWVDSAWPAYTESIVIAKKKYPPIYACVPQLFQSYSQRPGIFKLKGFLAAIWRQLDIVERQQDLKLALSPNTVFGKCM